MQEDVWNCVKEAGENAAQSKLSLEYVIWL